MTKASKRDGIYWSQTGCGSRICQGRLASSCGLSALLWLRHFVMHVRVARFEILVHKVFSISLPTAQSHVTLLYVCAGSMAAAA